VKNEIPVSTRHGDSLWLSDPKPESVRLADIAHSLGQKARFNGHLSRRISVAQHSVAVSLLVWRLCESHTCRDQLAREALLHDAHEAYVGDMTRPVKQQLGAVVRDLEARVQSAVWRAFGQPDIGLHLDAWVTVADDAMMVYEAHLFLPHAQWAHDAHTRRDPVVQDALSAIAGKLLVVYAPLSDVEARDLFLRHAHRLGLATA
jgi:hypothetical protein